MNPKTYSAKASELQPQWYLIDAQGQVLGRLASDIAQILKGKYKPMYTPHLNCGDFVVVVNADKVAVTRDRLDEKVYYRHSQYPGGFKTETLRQAMEKHPERVIERAVKGMLPHNRLGADMLHRLKVYKGPQHPHEAQQPVAWQRPTAESMLAQQAAQEKRAQEKQTRQAKPAAQAKPLQAKPEQVKPEQATQTTTQA